MTAILPKVKLLPWIILVLLLAGLTLVLLTNKYSQDIRSKAVLWPQTLTRVLVAPGQITTSLSSSPTNLSALAYDQYDQPIVSGVTYEWGISSTNTVGTLNSLDNLAEFTPLNTGTGNLYVIARQSAIYVIGSVVVDVSLDGPPATPFPQCIYCQNNNDCPQGQSCAVGGYCHLACLDSLPPCLVPEPYCPRPSPSPAFTTYYLKLLLQAYTSLLDGFFPDGKLNMLDAGLIMKQLSVPQPSANAGCAASGGTWELFPDSCADSCEIVNNPNPVCLQVITASCDCGPDKCWDGLTCINNPL